MNAKRLCCALAVFFLAQLGEGKVTRVSIGTPPAAWSPRFEDVDRLFVPSAQAVKVVVKDERASGSILGVRRGKGSDLDFFAAEDPAAVAQFVEKSASEALTLLGLKPGEGGFTLEIVIPSLWIESYEFGSGFAAANFLAWGGASATLRSAEGQELVAKSYPVAMWYLLAPGSGKALGFSASFLFERLAWEVTASTLVPSLKLQPDAAQVRRLFAFPVRNTPIGKAQVVFWLGFAGFGSPEVIDWMYRTFRTAEGQKVYQEAAIALARSKAPGAAEEIEAVLTGRKRLEEWEPEDAEQAFYLLRALEMLGVRELGPKIPATKNLQSKLQDLVKLYEAGELPAMSAGEQAALERAKAELK